jgi:hypothetical protein
MLRNTDKGLKLGHPLGLVVPRYEPYAESTGGANAAGSGGTDFAVGAVANTKTGWTQIIASSSQRADGLLITVSPSNIATADYLVDIGIGGAGSETVLLSNLLYSVGSSATGFGPISIFCPIYVAPGTRISARAQSSDTSAVGVSVIVRLIKGGTAERIRSTVATTYGADTSDSGGTAVDPGGSAHTKGAWTEISASVSVGFDSCLLLFGQRNNASNANQNMLLDIGVGASGSESVIFADMYMRILDVEQIYPNCIWLPISVKPGQRLAARCQCSGIDATDRVIDLVVVGFSGGPK